jgi:hypothetical protein
MRCDINDEMSGSNGNIWESALLLICACAWLVLYCALWSGDTKRYMLTWMLEKMEEEEEGRR